MNFCPSWEVAPNGTAKALLPLAPNKLQGRRVSIGRSGMLIAEACLLV